MAMLSLAVALLFDAVYLGALVSTPRWPEMSYVVLSGLVVGAFAAWRWWQRPGLPGWQAVLLSISLLLPFTSWLKAYRIETERSSDSDESEPMPRRDFKKRLGMLVLLGLVLLASVSEFAERRVLGPVLAPTQVSAITTLDRSLTLAAASYASARLIDRGIALAAEAELTLPFIGGVAVKPGQVFKPLQDMAERYSDVMVVAMASIGIQRVLLEMGEGAAITVLGSLSAVLLMMALVFSGLSRRLVLLARGVVIVLVVARLALPLMITGVGFVSDALLEERRQQAQQSLNVATAELQQADVDTLEEEEGLTQWLNDLRERTADMTLSVRQFSDDMVERFVQLLVVYLLETLLLPLAALWALWRMLRTLFAPRWITEERERLRLE
ncbi:hypothetical protein [Halomonas sp. M20]|uniref:hypothetical protein n=1 Tax=Halomonas sp. M20 TaxID=2763264 RepID=UPI001D0B8FD5|nr:hypothetical protein [Halomonas sp. M20]